jgi:hypothetical protein
MMQTESEAVAPNISSGNSLSYCKAYRPLSEEDDESGREKGRA